MFAVRLVSRDAAKKRGLVSVLCRRHDTARFLSSSSGASPTSETGAQNIKKAKKTKKKRRKTKSNSAEDAVKTDYDPKSFPNVPYFHDGEEPRLLPGFSPRDVYAFLHKSKRPELLRKYERSVTFYTDSFGNVQEDDAWYLQTEYMEQEEPSIYPQDIEEERRKFIRRMQGLDDDEDMDKQEDGETKQK